MKFYTLLAFLYVFASCSAETNKGFGDKLLATADFQPTTKRSEATYYIEMKSIGSETLLSVNPNSSFDIDGLYNSGTGYTFNVPIATGYGFFYYDFYNFNDEKVMNAVAYVNQTTSEWTLSGPAKWFRKDGTVSEIGYFCDGLKCRIFVQYATNGDHTGYKYYVAGKEYRPASVDKRLQGQWYSADHQPYRTYLFNEFFEDGFLQIWQQFQGDEYTPKKEIQDSDKSYYVIDYKSTGVNKAEVRLIDFGNGATLSREVIEYVSEDEIISTMVEISDPSIKGEKFTFYRMK